MKRSVTLWILILLALPSLFAQLPPNQPEQDCFGAIPLCQNTYFQPNAYQGRGEEPDEINGTISCMILGERNSVWYIFKVQTPGNLCFTIIPVDSTDDYDWAVYNLTNASCAQIGRNPALEVACNFTYNTGCAGETGPNGRTDCAGQFESCIPVQTGETYVLNVSNFNASNAGYTIDFSQSDATLFDDVNPELTSVSSFCTGVEVEFSENVLCGTVDPGDFAFSGPDGPYTISQVMSENCDAGGTYDNTFRLVVDPPIQQAGNYTIALVGPVSDFCGNGAQNYSGTVYMPLPPTADMAQLAPQCQGDNLFTYAYTGPSAVAAYAWEFGDGATSILPAPQHSYSGYGDMDVTLTIRDVNGCEDTVTKTMVVHPAPIARPQIIPPSCEDDSLTFISLSQYPDATPQSFNWRLGDGTNTSQPVFEHVFTSPGIYPVMIQTTNNFGCEDTASMKVTIWPKPEVEFITEENVCLGETATLKSKSTIMDWDGDEIASWVWNMGDSTLINDELVVSHTYASGGPQNVLLTVTSNKGCADSLYKEQMIWAPEPPNLQPDTVCVGQVSFMVALPDSLGETRWYNNFNETEPFWRDPAYPTVPVLYPQTYYVEQFTIQGCLSERVPIIATTWPVGEGWIQLADSVIELPIAETSPLLAGSIEGAEYNWHFGDETVIRQPTPTHQYAHPGIYEIELNVLDVYGCPYELSRIIEVKDPTRILAASAFTPNGDGINDEWRVVQRFVNNYEVKVFNRMGQVVFATTDPEQGWNGIDDRGRISQEGVYVFSVKGIDAEGNDREESGTITLLR